jgi:hypothetical protein
MGATLSAPIEISNGLRWPEVPHIRRGSEIQIVTGFRS